ncbi:hypothetical protein PCE1_004639 [Barthelona sp. PCE]
MSKLEEASKEMMDSMRVLFDGESEQSMKTLELLSSINTLAKDETDRNVERIRETREELDVVFEKYKALQPIFAHIDDIGDKLDILEGLLGNLDGYTSYLEQVLASFTP